MGQMHSKSLSVASLIFIRLTNTYCPVELFKTIARKVFTFQAIVKVKMIYLLFFDVYKWSSLAIAISSKISSLDCFCMVCSKVL